MNVLEEITQSRFLLVMLNEAEYEKSFSEMLKGVEKTGKKICYVCLSSTYKDVIASFKERGIDATKFFFIDTLTSHYDPSSETKNCIFVSSPAALDDLRDAIKRAVEKEKCDVVIFDTITSLLIYQETFSITKFANNLAGGKEYENTKKVFIVLKDVERMKNENQTLAKDIGMFADKTINM
jgi:archaellum biogenesis ATPase FlaH